MFTVVVDLLRVPGWSLAVGTVPSLNKIKFIVWLPVVVVGEAPTQVGLVPVLADWMFAPLGVELQCLPLCGHGMAVVLGLVGS